MKLEVTAKYLFARNCIKAVISTILLFILYSPNLIAQKYQLDFNNISLSEALIKASKQFDFKVAFDARKLSEIKINRNVSGNTLDEFLDNLLFNSGYGFQFKHDSYLIVFKDEKQNIEEFKECQIIGTVSDEETGEQLPFATIKVPELNYYTQASSNGSFYISHVVTNTSHLNISYIGYFSIDTVIKCSSPKMNCNFKLYRKLEAISKVIVNEPKIEMVEYRNDVDFVTTINPAKLIDLPILAETDIFRALQLLPGISYSENSSELNIRGGSSDQNLLLYDGQTLYNLSHYYGVFSSINPNIVKDIQVYKGGYDSRYGERVSGVVDITSKSGNQLKPTIYGDLNLISGNLAVEVPISEKLTIIAAGRRSYSDIYSTQFANNLINENTNPTFTAPGIVVTQSTPSYYFYDYNTKLTYRLNKKENISASIYGGKDYYNNIYRENNDTLSSVNQDKNTWGNYGIAVAWLKQWNGAFYSNLQIGTSGYNNSDHKYSSDTTFNILVPKNINDSISNINSFNQNKLSDYSLSFRSIYYLNNNNQLNFGILSRRNDIYYYNNANTVDTFDNINQSAWVNSIYAH